ncbi:MAG: hypothetical protein GEV04_04170 [Actinophytocola sp.]|nr:hypothetical protein [Actinophytocola sp.]
MTTPQPPYQPYDAPHGAGHPDVKPSKTLYGVAIGVFVLALVGAALVGANAVTGFPGPVAELTSGEQQQVTLDEEGLTIFVDRTPANGRCQATDDGGTPVELGPTKGTESVTASGTEWHVLLRSAEPVPPGTYTVTCVAEDTAGAARFGVGPHASVFGAVAMIFGAFGVALLGSLIAVIIGLVTFFRRRSALRKIQQQPLWGGYPPYPPQSFTG